MNELDEIAAGETGGLGLAVGGVVAGRYELHAHLGGGRFGSVFEAVDRALSGGARERRVVLHAIDPMEADALLAALERCRSAPQAWLHPNIVKVLDFGRSGSTAYVLTELLEGLTLRRVLDDIAPEVLEPEEAFAIVGKIGAALRYAHAKGIVHGDLRPETVFVTTSFAVKVLDFWPLPAVALADPDAADAMATPSDDVYALACVAYELFTGRHPFNGNAPSEARLAELKPAPIVGLTHGRWQAIARGLALESSERTPSVAEFLAELGVTGQEEIPRSGRSQPQPLEEAPKPAPPPPPRPRYAPPPDTRVAPPAWQQANDADIPTLRSPVRTRRARTARAPRRRRSGSWLFLLPVVLIAGLAYAVLRDYDEMRGAVTELIAAGAERVEGDRDVVSPPSPETLPVVTTDAAASRGADGVAAAATAEEAAAANAPEAIDAAEEPAAPPGEPVATVAADEPQPAEQIDERPSERTGARTQPRPVDRTTAATLRRGPAGARAAGNGAAVAGSEEQGARVERDAQLAVADAPPPAASAPGFALVASRVTAAEGDAAARVTIRHTGREEPVRVFWWTGGHTAQADDDYADLEGVETLAPGQSLDILVPLADDVWPEDAESFFVYFGLDVARRRTQTPTAQAEVLVVDDDR